MARPGCQTCGQGRRSRSTARTPEKTAAPRVGDTAPVRYVVNGKKFSTLTAAQDYARSRPGSVIRRS